MSRSGRSDVRPAIGRRRLLALAGTGVLAALAGCSGLLSDSEPTIDADALAEVVAEDAPSAPETIPVDIEPAFVDEQRSTAAATLDGVPAPFDREAIPNGVIRERLNDSYEAATEALETIDEGETPYGRLGRANRARVAAREVRAGWRAIEEDLTQADLREEVPAIENGIDEVAARWSYVGDDPVRAVVVHAEIEDELRAARNWIAPDRGRPADGNALGVADLAEDLERARTSVAVASYLFERFHGSLDTTTGQRGRFEAAREELRVRVRESMSGLPPRDVDEPTALVDRDVDETAGVRALASLGSEARYRAKDVTASENRREGPSLANDVVGATDALVYIRGFESLRERIEGGDDLAVESVEDVAALRSAAVSAVERARDATRGALLVDAMLPWYANEIRWIDDRLRRESGSVTVDSVAYDAIDYIVAAETCRALPPACADAAAALRES